jgi:hypothetical protein
MSAFDPKRTSEKVLTVEDDTSNAVTSGSKFFDLNQIQGSPAYARVFLTAQMRQHPTATGVTINKGEFR